MERGLSAPLQNWLENQWRQPPGRFSLAGWALRPLSWLYGAAVALRQTLYAKGFLSAQALSVPVIVVGNVLVGGAGKTPVTMALVQALKQRGFRPGVIARGYGRTSTQCLEVQPQSTAAEVGDEPLLIHRITQVPVFVASKRMEAGEALLAAHPETDIILCDDGLQHWALHRDAQICVFPAWGAGNGLLLPAGPLREPWPRRRGQAIDAVVQIFDAPAQAPSTIASNAPLWRAQRHLADHARNAQGQCTSLQRLAAQERPVVAVAGIAHPSAFFSMLQQQGVPVGKTIALSDHYDFSAGLPSSLLEARSTNAIVLCTEKDAVKLWPLWPEAWAVPLQLDVDEGLVETLLDVALQRQARRCPR